MLKLSSKTIINYSPNFDPIKRSAKDIKFIVFHYTGMRSETGSINRLTDKNSKVSCHYLIKYNGEIIQIVPDLYIAWHAGISSWKKDREVRVASENIVNMINGIVSQSKRGSFPFVQLHHTRVR